LNAWYNEIEPYAVAWLRNLSDAGHIARGTVEERSVRDLRPEDVGAGQCHFFAGIGVWSRALRLAGVPDDLPVWTGSCPCQPFSAAGKRRGFDDDRHLWPDWFRLIRERRPAIVFGEQVANGDGLKWFDAVSADLEGAGYAVGAADLCAAGVGAPHIRQRLYFVAYADERAGGQGCALVGQRDPRGDADFGAGSRSSSAEFLANNNEGFLGPRLHLRERGPRRAVPDAAGGGEALGLGNNNNNNERPQGRRVGGDGADQRAPRSAGVAGGLGRSSSEGPLPGALGGVRRIEEGARPRDAEPERPGGALGVGDSSSRSGRDAGAVLGAQGEGEDEGRAIEHQPDEPVPAGAAVFTATRGFWAGADWVFCRDGRWRPVEPGTFPLAHGAPARVGRLRAYGNAIVPQVAAVFIRAALESIGGWA